MSNPYGHVKHGLCHTSLYAVWTMMKQRCNNPNNKEYQWYGARGIKVCEERLNVETFYEWCMNHGYKEGLTIDRIDTNKDYEPSNCRFLTRAEQQSNKTNTHFIEYEGEVHTLTQWSEILGIPRTTLSNRLILLGWSIERAFGKEVVS